jgi:hypothetical protein
LLIIAPKKPAIAAATNEATAKPQQSRAPRRVAADAFLMSTAILDEDGRTSRPLPLGLSQLGFAGNSLKTLSKGYQGFCWVPILHLLFPQLSRNKVMTRAVFIRFCLVKLIDNERRLICIFSWLL